MFSRRLTLALSVFMVALSAGSVSAAHAAAKTRVVAVTGQVAGYAYAAEGKTAIPVLLTKASARKTKLRSPAGVLLVISGLISTTPTLNSRFAAGLALLAIDVPFLRKPTARLIEWGLDKWEGLRERFRGRERDSATARRP